MLQLSWPRHRELPEQVPGALDRPGDELREERHECAEADDVGLGLAFAAPHVDDVGELLEGEEADPDRQHDAQRDVRHLRPAEPRQPDHRVGKEIEVFEKAEQQQVEDDARDRAGAGAALGAQPVDVPCEAGEQRDQAEAHQVEAERHRQPRAECDGAADQQQQRRVPDLAALDALTAGPLPGDERGRGGDDDQRQEAQVPDRVEDVARHHDDEILHPQPPHGGGVAGEEHREESEEGRRLKQHLGLSVPRRTGHGSGRYATRLNFASLPYRRVPDKNLCSGATRVNGTRLLPRRAGGNTAWQ